MQWVGGALTCQSHGCRRPRMKSKICHTNSWLRAPAVGTAGCPRATAHSNRSRSQFAQGPWSRMTSRPAALWLHGRGRAGRVRDNGDRGSGVAVQPCIWRVLLQSCPSLPRAGRNRRPPASGRPSLKFEAASVLKAPSIGSSSGRGRSGPTSCKATGRWHMRDGRLHGRQQTAAAPHSIYAGL